MNSPKAASLIDHLGTLTVSQGRHAGEPLTVLSWQRKFVAGAFAPAARRRL